MGSIKVARRNNDKIKRLQAENKRYIELLEIERTKVAECEQLNKFYLKSLELYRVQCDELRTMKIADDKIWGQYVAEVRQSAHRRGMVSVLMLTILAIVVFTILS